MTMESIMKRVKSTFQLTSSRRGWRVLVWIETYNEQFQLTSSRRGWQQEKKDKMHMSLFQLTSSRRGWRDHSWQSHDESYFNSHPHEEDDIIQNFPAPSGNISTHILTKRMTVWRDVTMTDKEAFQLTSSRRGWPPNCRRIRQREAFQLTSSRRGWQGTLEATLWKKHFNSHPHEEDDCNDNISYTIFRYFNSHPHEEDDSNFKQK